MRSRKFIYCFIIIVIFFSVNGLTLKAVGNTKNDNLVKEAEAAFSDKSYARAEQLYSQIDIKKLPTTMQEWIQFRLLDCQCRNFLSGGNPGNANNIVGGYVTKLKALLIEKSENVASTGKQDDIILTDSVSTKILKDEFDYQIWEAIGDYYCLYPKTLQNKHMAWSYYSAVMDYWAGCADLNRAAENYLRIFWKYQNQEEKSGLRFREPVISEHTLHQVITIMKQYKIAGVNEELKVHICLAQTYQSMPLGPDTHYLIRNEYDTILKLVEKERSQNHKTPEGFDLALFNYANWLEQHGHLEAKEEGRYSNLPDYEKALNMYQKILGEYTEKNSKVYGEAKNRINLLTENQLRLFVSSFFTPDSDIEFSLNARNVKTINISLYSIDLNKDIEIPQTYLNTGVIWGNIKSSGKQSAYNLQITNTAQSHFEFNTNIVINPELPTGAYLLEAKSDNVISRELVLISDIAAVLRSAPDGNNLIYVCDAFTGKPLENATVRLAVSLEQPGTTQHKYYSLKEANGKTDKNGLINLPVSTLNRPCSSVVTVSTDDGKRQTILFSQNHFYSENEALKCFVFADRPAYRPEETVYWKTIVRKEDSNGYSTPSHKKMQYTLYNPDMEKVLDGEVELNDFGSAGGQFELKKEMQLGEYQIEFKNVGNYYGRAVLFRLEEYKLPDYRVSIVPVCNDLQTKNQSVSYRLGDTIRAKIKVEYFWGGPVSNAKINAAIHSKNYYHTWKNSRRYDWLYENFRSLDFGNGTFQKSENLVTDSNGEAFILFDTPRSEQEDVEYTISADVTDSLQRNIHASEKVIVTKQSYYANITTDGNVHTVGNNVDITLSTQDANKNPKISSGQLTIQRKSWKEVWISPNGNLIEGEELIHYKQKIGLENFPPPAEKGKRAWKLKFRGYEYENILDERITTDEKGKFVANITPSKCGYYEIKWIGEDWLVLEDSGKIPWSPVTASAFLWIGDTEGASLAMNNSSLQIHLPENSAEIGETVPVLIQTDFPGRYVLFTIEAESIIHQQVIKMENDSLLLNIPVTEAFAPNIWMNALEIRDRALFQSNDKLIVPQTHKFINIAVNTDQKQYQPRDDVSLELATTDYNGNPISAEVALSVVDEAIYSIQEEYAQDPRKFFFGKERSYNITVANSFWRSLLRIEHITPTDDEVGVEDSAADELPVRGRMLKRAYATGSVRNEAIADMAVPVMAESGGGRMLLKSAATMSQPEATSEVIVIRNNFASTAHWNQNIITDSNGTAKINFKMPDNITEWRLNALANSSESHFGKEKSTFHTLQPLMIRPQAPRFFIVGDRASVSALIENSTEQEMTVEVKLDFDGSKGLVFDKDCTDTSIVTVPAKGSYTQYWNLVAVNNSSARIKITAHSAKTDSKKSFSDAVLKTYPVYNHGIKQYKSESAKLQEQPEIIVQLAIPSNREASSTLVQIHLSSSLLALAKESLPYLLDYPYGNTDQVMERFLPALAISKLTQIKQDSDILGDTGMKLGDVIQQSLGKIYELQHADHGWSWISDYDSDSYITSYILWCLFQAKTQQINVNPEVINGAVAWIMNDIMNCDSFLQAWVLFSMTSELDSWEYIKALNEDYSTQLENIFSRLYDERDSLTSCTRALLTISAISMNKTRESDILVKNIENSVIFRQDDLLAHWETDSIGRRLESSAITTAFALKALARKDSNNPLIQPIVNWIVKNRRGTNWGNSRDTAISLLALCDFLKYKENPAETAKYTLLFNETEVSAGNLDSLNALVINIPNELLKENNSIKLIKQQGKAPIYMTASAEYFTTEEPVKAISSEIVIDRKYFRIDKVPTLLKGPAEQKVPLNTGDKLKTGDVVEVALTLNTQSELYYLALEDLKPSSLESVYTQSGFTANIKQLFDSGEIGRHLRLIKVYQEQRDRSVVSFLKKLPEGKWVLSYRFNVEIPGEFHALPALIESLYLPECKANSSEQILHIDRKN